MQRVIAIKRGFTAEDEFDVAERLLEAPRAGTAAGKSIKPHLRRMVAEYYEHMGWDKNGVPTRTSLDRVGLEGLM
jgi:aldehyde:ferredoxin oxidoreductase